MMEMVMDEKLILTNLIEDLLGNNKKLLLNSPYYIKDNLWIVRNKQNESNISIIMRGGRNPFVLEISFKNLLLIISFKYHMDSRNRNEIKISFNGKKNYYINKCDINTKVKYIKTVPGNRSYNVPMDNINEFLDNTIDYILSFDDSDNTINKDFIKDISKKIIDTF